MTCANYAHSAPIFARPEPTIDYCVDAAKAYRLVDEIIGEAGDRPIAIDVETTPNKAEVDRLTALRIEDAVVRGKLRAARKAHASADTIGALTAEVKNIGARIAYADKAALDPYRSRVRLLQLYGGGRHVAVIDLDRAGEGVLKRLHGERLVAHNAAFELSFLEKAGVEPGEIHCSLQACRLTLGEHATSLAEAAKEHLGLELDKAPQTSDWSAADLSARQIEYAAEDVVVCWRLAQHVLPALADQAAAYEIQMAAVPAAMRMERRGFRLDLGAHAKLMDELVEERAAATEDFVKACIAANHPALAANVPSTPRQKDLLLQTLLTSDELARWPRTERSGALSTRRSDLRRAAHYPPIMALVGLSSVDKLLTAFGSNLVALVSPVTGRIHAHYRVAGASSGRASCSGPNLQQIPRDQRFRALFKPEPGCVLVLADYSSMELRAAAQISGDPTMTKAFEDGLDLHKLTAARMTGKQPDEVTSEERRAAKAVNFGACYGLGAKGLVRSAWDGLSIVMTEHEAARWLRAFEAAYPRFARWRREHAERCEEMGRIVIGRDAARGLGRFYPLSRLPDGASAYTRACNLPVQGACADASMLALAGIDRLLFEHRIDGGPVGWLHDEIVMEVAVEDAEQAAELLRQAMVNAFAETFPGAPLRGLVEPHVGMSWGEAKSRTVNRLDVLKFAHEPI